ncbi:hypothetical protein LZZ85_27805 [Terrimonas sp. NA20]|uniref:Uncharacterized protein n=1 Tax=Terrimonas ginsenosidimutans TaxID=2908004 RepID=A0ABS9L0Q5_9BACT|nr:hypothetical protein [Terrimonas ginsenosidimutans]MCG2618140.1 hypothetical protein [Terrimonas ginsenosidimutans]
MKAFILAGFLLFNLSNDSNNPADEAMSVNLTREKAVPAPELSISFPKNNQKVRGAYKIYGKAKPGSVVELHVSSSYFKTTRDERKKIAKGEGPVARMNRKFSLKADRNGTWLLKEIELLNAGWEETFIIKATADKKSVSIRVYDNTRPVRID